MAKILVSMPDKFLNKIDQIADTEQRTRSELIREALRNYMRANRIQKNERSENAAKLLEEML